MKQQRLGVSCKFCGQPVVLIDAEPGEVFDQVKLSRAVAMRCMSCGRRASYSRASFQAFEAAELASGDWEAVPANRRSALRVG